MRTRHGDIHALAHPADQPAGISALVSNRLPAELEATSLLRRAEADGDFATVLRRGDPERGSLLLVITSRGRHAGCLERVLDFDTGGYRWQPSGPAEDSDPQQLADFLARRTKSDEDLWLIELDVARPERFIAETTANG